jgi:UDP-2,3-diacylglucosamine hydrolase
MSSSRALKSLSDRPIYLVADLHLEAGCPETTQLFLDFLAGPARQSSALYILGDLFEVWIGDDGAAGPAFVVAQNLNALTAAGVPVHFLPGNRDFLLGENYCAQAGMQQMEEPFLLPETKPATALMHGDSLCTDDRAYQRFRTKVRDPAWQEKTLAKPLWWRRLLSRIARTVSKQRNRNKPAEIMDVNPQAVADSFRQLGIDRLIHGHTHRPAIHRLRIDDRPVIRVVLGDWHPGRGSAVRIEQSGGLELLELGYDTDGLLHMEPTDREPA